MKAALSAGDSVDLIMARTIANADTRNQQLNALSLCESPTLAREGATIDQPTMHAAMLGQAQAHLSVIVRLAERLATELDETRLELADTRARVDQMMAIADDAISAAFSLGADSVDRMGE